MLGTWQSGAPGTDHHVIGRAISLGPGSSESLVALRSIAETNIKKWAAGAVDTLEFDRSILVCRILQDVLSPRTRLWGVRSLEAIGL